MDEIEQKPPIFEYFPPQNGFKGVVSIPHSGENLPEEFAPYLISDNKALMQDVDYQVHNLVDIKKLQAAGLAVIKSEIIRVAVDLNRSKETAVLNWKSNSKGVKIVKDEPTPAERQLLEEKYYTPYVEMLRTMMNELARFSAKPSFVDLHSMPSKAEEYHLKINPHQARIRPDFCLSDQKGLTCEKDFIEFFSDQLANSYNNVKQNDPYVGGFITVNVNNLFPSCNNIQIEISRALYMDETDKKMKETSALKTNLTDALIAGFDFFFDRYKL